MIVNLEFIKATVTAEELLLLDHLRQELLLLVEQLKRRFLYKSHVPNDEMLPFEFQVLEFALEIICGHLDLEVANLESIAYPLLYDLVANASDENLEHLLNLKRNLTRLLASIQKVFDEIKLFLYDDKDMSKLYLTRKCLQNEQSGSVTSKFGDDNDVEDLEMLPEAYFIQLDGTRNKILSAREYIDDTERSVSIRFDHKRNELEKLKLKQNMETLSISVGTLECWCIWHEHSFLIK